MFINNFITQRVINGTNFINKRVKHNINNKLYFLGNGQEKCERLIKKNSNLIFSSNDTFPSANEMAFLSFEKFNNSKFDDIAYFEPDYLKSFMPG